MTIRRRIYNLRERFEHNGSPYLCEEFFKDYVKVERLAWTVEISPTSLSMGEHDFEVSGYVIAPQDDPVETFWGEAPQGPWWMLHESFARDLRMVIPNDGMVHPVFLRLTPAD